MPQIINIADEMRQNNLAYQQQQDDQLKRQLLQQQIQIGPVHNALASAQLQDYLRNQQDEAQIRQTAQQADQANQQFQTSKAAMGAPATPQPDAMGTMQPAQLPVGVGPGPNSTMVAVAKAYVRQGKMEEAKKVAVPLIQAASDAGDHEGAIRLANDIFQTNFKPGVTKGEIHNVGPDGALVRVDPNTGKVIETYRNPKESTDTAAEVDRKEELKWIKDNTLPGEPPPTHLEWLTAKSAATAKASDKTPPTNVYREQFYKENGRYPTIAETDAHEKANRPPKEAATVTIQTVDTQGNPITKVMTKADALKASSGSAGGITAPPAAMTRNRIVSGKNSMQAGNDIIKMLDDPKIRAQLGPIMGRATGWKGLIGNIPPNMSELAGALKSWTELQPAVHGMRSSEMAEDIEKSVPLKWTPEALQGFIRGFNRTAKIVAESDVPKPPAGSDPLGLFK